MSERGKSGIYVITNTFNGKRYVGQAASIGDRWLTHKSQLNRGRHLSRHLQKAWNKYGADSFTFSVLEYVAAETAALTQREQAWMDEFRPEYNVAPAAATALGMKHPPRSEEFKRRQSEQRKGFKHSAETIVRLREIAAQKRADGTIYRPTAEHRQKLRASAHLLHTPEAIEKRRAAMTGRKQSPENVAKRAAKMIGHITSEHTKKKIGEANRTRLLGTKQSPELIEKRVAPLRGKKRPEAVIKAMHDALRVSRQPQIDAIKEALRADPGLNQTQLAKRLKCARSTIRKYKAEMLASGAEL